MADPKLYLPPALSHDSIRQLIDDLGLPEPCGVEALQTIAEYHTLYVVQFDARHARRLQARAAEPGSTISLILRVAGKHLPRIKTQNEVAVLSWVRNNTRIPVPVVVGFDASSANAIGHEFTLLEKMDGVSVDTVYTHLDESKKAHLVSQLLDYLLELHRHPWQHCGGLSISEVGEVGPGRVVAETFWQGPEIAQYWGPDESVESLNPGGPYPDYTSYVKAHMAQYTKNIETHESLCWVRNLIPRIQAFIDFLNQHTQELDRTRNILTHGDLHFGNIMCDPASADITGILDWEFSAVLPLPLWGPGKSFLWNGNNTPESKAEQGRLHQVFRSMCEERSLELLADLDLKEQEPYASISTVLNFVRAIVEVCPRGQKLDSAKGWKQVAENAMVGLGL